jgi:hypothetical protein
MIRQIKLFLLGLTALLAVPVFGAADFLARSFDRTVAPTNESIVVTVNFTNPEPSVLRGFYYADQVPSELEVTPLSLTLDGQSITNYTFESGQDGDVYAGCTPYRWVLEQPGSFPENNPVPPQAHAQIVYALRSAVSGTFVLQQFGWVGYDPAGSNALFGFSESTDQQTLSILSPFLPSPVLTITNERVNLTFPTVSGVSYTVEFKDELTAAVWQPLNSVTGSGETMLVEDPAELRASRFYRLRAP